jgi:hypothetical protein
MPMDRPGRRALIAFVAALAGVAGLGGTARAATIHIEFNDVTTSLGALTDKVLIAPGDPPGTADGEYNPADGSVTIPAENWKMPRSREFEAAPGVNVAVEFKANAPVTGTYDAATGALNLTVDNSVTTFVIPLAVNCTIPSSTVSLSSGNSFAGFAGAPFAPSGALVASAGGIRQAGTVTITDQPSGTTGGTGGGTSTSAPSTSAASSGAKFGPRVGAIFTAKGAAQRGGYAFSGKVSLPAGVRPVDGCAGAIGVQIKAGRNTVSYTTTRLEDDCTFSHDVDLGRKRTRGRKVRAIIRFNGNQALLPEKLDAMMLSGAKKAQRRAHTRGRLRLRARIAGRARGTLHAPPASLLAPGARQVGKLARAVLNGM